MCVYGCVGLCGCVFDKVVLMSEDVYGGQKRALDHWSWN